MPTENQKMGLAMALSFTLGFAFFRSQHSAGGEGGLDLDSGNVSPIRGGAGDPTVEGLEDRGQDRALREHGGGHNERAAAAAAAATGQQPPTSIEILVRYGADSPASKVRLGLTASDAAVKEAIATATGLPFGHKFGLVATDGVVVTASIGSLVTGASYEARLVPAPCAPAAAVNVGRSNSNSRRSQSVRTEGLKLPGEGAHGILDSTNNVMLSDRPAKLPRVIIASLGTGRYRKLAIDAMESGIKFFGGDCEPSFHVLSDEMDGIPEHLNGAYAPYREWPESGLSKFKDLLSALGDEMRKADYFFFLDADVRFMEPVQLVDIGADLMGVEHPMYPRYDFGWCKPQDPNTRGFCQFPYERKPESTARIPDGHGRYVKEKKYVVSNAYYLQSAFWGGKASNVIKMFEELIPNIEEDGRNKYYSRILQDERHFNYYFWKHQNDSDINMRILSPSYLYPYHPVGFTEWVTKENRPIVVHGIGKKSGKLIKGATELFCEGTRKCMDLFSGKPIGFYGCHHVADSQGFMFEKTHVIRTASRGIPNCIDGDGVAADEAVNLNPCDEKNKGMQWDLDPDTKQLINRQSGLCLDPMVDPNKFPESAKNAKKAPAGVVECDANSKYQRFAFRDI